MRTVKEYLEAASKTGSLAAAALQWQIRHSGKTESEIRAKMLTSLEVMRRSSREGLAPDLRSVSGMVGGQAHKLLDNNNSERFGVIGKACAYALGIAEYNACMGQIVAAPTAGSCGILPGALLAVQEKENFSNDQLADALFTAAAFGRIIAIEATISGAEGGCQAECGAAAAMAAAAIVQLYGGTPEMSAHACAFTLMNMLGLVCDPVHGLVEIPCVYRNAGGVSQAFAAAQMALCGISCPIPCDEMIRTMKDVGDVIPPSLRETGDGGCAACPCMHASGSFSGSF